MTNTETRMKRKAQAEAGEKENDILMTRTRQIIIKASKER